MTSEVIKYNGDEIAVVGMSLRVPGAKDPWTFWDNLAAGRESFEQLSDAQLLKAGVAPSLLDNPRFVKLNAALSDVSQFDARFFGLSPFDATLMDPQYRHFLELAWEALEFAGIDTAKYKGSVGVYGGSGQNGYLMHHLMSQARLVVNPGHWYLRHVGNDKDFMTTRASYHLDLKGPSVNVQTACSTSLVAIHLACSALISRECDLALAGGVTIEFPHATGYLSQENGIEDPRGQCRSYDASSKGTVFGSGGGVVALKRLEDAQADEDHIFGVIKASAVSNDGQQKAGYTAPSVDGQVAAILEALDLGEINPESIGYVEGHGTGTPIGDPIEVQALTTAWRATTQKRQFAALSSSKSNVGHLDTAAGVVSFIKAIGTVYQGIKYPTVHFKKPNPALDIESSPFYISNQAQQWDGFRRAAVSSLGVGGTNAHVILEQPPERKISTFETSKKLVLGLSAKTPTALQAYKEKLFEFLIANGDDASSYTLANVSKSLQRRRGFEYRAVFLASSLEEAMQSLDKSDSYALGAHKACSRRPEKVAFAFTGQGTQYFNMGRTLYDNNVAYRQAFDTCAELLLPTFKRDIREIIFVDEPSQAQRDYLDQIDVTHPVLFSLAYSLAKAWIAEGVTPDAMIGHSLGEYVAATLAGVFELEQVLKLVCERGRLMQSTPLGVMLSVAADEQDLLPYLENPAFKEKLSIAGVNVRGMSVVAGYPEPMKQLITVLEKDDISCKPLRIPRASHCVMMDSILEDYEHAVAQCHLKPARIPIVSNIDGQWLSPDASARPDYWRAHLRSAVRFADGADTLMKDPKGYLFIEIGPGSQLSRLLEAHPSRQDRHGVIHSMPGPKDDVRSDVFFQLGLGRAWAVGALESIPGPDLSQAQVVPLPTYAWDHQHLWVEREVSRVSTQSQSLEKQSFEDWFSVPGWHRALSIGQSDYLKDRQNPVVIVMFDDESEPLRQFLHHLKALVQVVCVERSDVNVAKESVCGETGCLEFYLNSLDEQATPWLLEQVEIQFPDLTQDLVAVVEWIEPKGLPSLWARSQSRVRQYFDQVFYTAKAMSQYEWSQLKYVAVGQGLLDVSGGDIDDPMKTLVQGPIRALAAEQACVESLFLDFDVLALKNDRLFSGLIREILTSVPIQQSSTWDEISFRGSERYVRSFDQQILPIPDEFTKVTSKMRKGGNYLIAGLGDLALVTAQFIVDQWQGTPIFLTRTGLAPEHDWAEIAESARIDIQAQRIRALLGLKQLAPQLLVVAVDVTQEEKVREAVHMLQAQRGRIHGVFHTAGVLDDQLLSFKTLQEAHKVLAPKVGGLAFYDVLMAEQPLDFVLLFSSISSLVGLAGQSDYGAANGFLASWARVQNQQLGRPVCAIHWGAWSEVGMAVNAAKAMGLQSQVSAFSLNQLEACHLVPSSSGVEQHCYGRFVSKNWVLNDHRTQKGLAVMPGTGVIDLLANTYRNLTGASKFVIEQLSFQTPFALSNEAQVLGAVIAKSNVDGGMSLRFVSGSCLGDIQDQLCEVHSEAQCRPMDRAAPILQFSKLRQSYTQHRTYEHNEHAHMRFGARWQCLKQAWFGDNGALLSLELPDSFVEDLDHYPWHPGLLDMAIGGQELIGCDLHEHFFVPLYYERIEVFSSLEQRCWSHVQLRSEPAAKIAVFDIQICNDDGQCLLNVQGFHLRKTQSLALDVVPLKAMQGQRDLLTPRENKNELPLDIDDADIFALSLAQGIRPLEGQKALKHILQFDPLPSQLVVASMGLEALKGAGAPQEQQEEQLAERPVLSVAFVEPQGPLEHMIASVWTQALGLNAIGRDDQFFELGGHSLLLIQMIARLKKRIDIQIPMAQLFEASTIASWAKVIGTDSFETVAPANDTKLEKKSEEYQQQSVSLVQPIDRNAYRV